MYGDSGTPIIKTNYWPAIIEERIGSTTRIGNASGSIHAETACLFEAWKKGIPTDQLRMIITDPPCPNCSKNLVEAGIRYIALDSAGYEKAYFKENENDFRAMSLEIYQRAGVQVDEIFLNTEKVKTLVEMEDDAYIPPDDSPPLINTIQDIDNRTFDTLIAEAARMHEKRKHCVAIGKKTNGEKVSLIVRAHPVIGHTATAPHEALEINNPANKYSFIQEPVNRLMMIMIRQGVRLEPGYLYCSQVPTSREQVNMVGAGIQSIMIGDLSRSRDSDGLAAMALLQEKNIMRFC